MKRLLYLAVLDHIRLKSVLGNDILSRLKTIS